MFNAMEGFRRAKAAAAQGNAAWWNAVAWSYLKLARAIMVAKNKARKAFARFAICAQKACEERGRKNIGKANSWDRLAIAALESGIV